jgi:hypothetical protein
MRHISRSSALAFAAFFLALSGTVAFAQVPTGTPPFGSFSGGPDAVNLGNLNVHIDVPVLSKAGRGTNFTYDLSYDTSVWYPSSVSGTNTWTPVYNWGWRAATEANTGYISFTQTTIPWCNPGGTYLGHQTTYSNWVYHDPWGVPHWFANLTTYYYQGPVGTCNNANAYTSGQGTLDGYTLSVTGPFLNSLFGASGQKINAPVNIGTGAAGFTDRNGNQITVNGSGQFFDTLSSGTAVLTVSGSGTPASPYSFSYTAPSGSASYTAKYVAKTVQTKFGCAGITDYGPTSTNLVSEIDLPDYNAVSNPNSRYVFSYEQTPGVPGNVTGRLTSVTLPTGGTITYQYTGGSSGNITCADGSASGLKRYTPDTGSNFWNYTRTPETGAAYITLVTDPQANQTIIQFQGLYETQRNIYSGTAPS